MGCSPGHSWATPGGDQWPTAVTQSQPRRRLFGGARVANPTLRVRAAADSEGSEGRPAASLEPGGLDRLRTEVKVPAHQDFGNYNTMNWRGWLEWYPATAMVWLWGVLSPRRRVSGYRVQKLRIPHQDWFQEDFRVLLELLRESKIHPVVAERLPPSDARHAHELLESSAAKGKLVLVP